MTVGVWEFVGVSVGVAVWAGFGASANARKDVRVSGTVADWKSDHALKEPSASHCADCIKVLGSGGSAAVLVRGASQAAIIELVPAVGSGPGPEFVPDGAGDRFPNSIRLRLRRPLRSGRTCRELAGAVSGHRLYYLTGGREG